MLDKTPGGEDPILLKKGMEISEDVLVEFTSTSRASTNGILKYDFFFSDGPNFISPSVMFSK
ncbi:hypothetical protein PsgB076_13014 [Pseudomonas savastanoi pv. glycinea str. B076]|nr:hypothetical protein PsgB076_13014 [Pseudomonas savastanoi pv. glycinea str. B076]